MGSLRLLRSATMKSKSNQSMPEEKEEDDEPQPPTDFSFALTRVAVSQICQSVGFKSIQRSALDTLTGVATIYLRTLSKLAASYSNTSSRTQSHLVDIIHALHDLSSAHGFVGASTLHCNDSCQLRSSVLRDIRLFVEFSDEIPFAKPLPRKQFSRNLERNLSVSSARVVVPPHIPKWLPALPDASTYKVSEKRCVGDEKRWWENNSRLIENCGGAVKGKKKTMRRGADQILPVERRSRVIFKIKR